VVAIAIYLSASALTVVSLVPYVVPVVVAVLARHFDSLALFF
jgi:hypothetical protein